MCTCVYKYLLISWFLLGRKLLHTFQYTHIRQEIQKVTVLGFKVGQPWIAFCSWIINNSGVHNGVIEIHWLVYTFPWWQLESARRRVPLLWPAALCSGLAALSCAGRTLKKSSNTSPPQKKNSTHAKRFSSSLNVTVGYLSVQNLPKWAWMFVNVLERQRAILEDGCHHTVFWQRYVL